MIMGAVPCGSLVVSRRQQAARLHPPPGAWTKTGWEAAMDNVNQPLDVNQPLGNQPLGPAERAELEALRRENAQLRRGQLETAARTPQDRHGASRALRWAASVVLLVLTAVLAITSVTANYL